MTSLGNTSAAKLDKFSKENRWYYTKLDGFIEPSSRKLLEEYSKIPAEEVDAHIYKWRDVLWSHAPYPCVGEFKFLTLNLPKHPLYERILSILKQSQSTSQEDFAQQPHPVSSPSQSQPQPPLLLDLGCCVAQELRALAQFGGVPSSQLYGSDLITAYLRTSYDLFKDEGTFKGTLVSADVFSPTLFGDKFLGWERKFSVIHAGLFLHLFNRPQEVVVCSRVLKMLKDEKGALFVGEMVGYEGGHETTLVGRGQYPHDSTTFPKLWEEVAEKTDTVGQWKVDARFTLREKRPGRDQDAAFFIGEGVGWLVFSVERI